jgi:hypothetical protein
VNSNTCRLFANGNLVQGPFYYTYWNANPTQLTFGAYGTPSSYGEPFLGGLSNISIYHRALTPDEIQTLYVDSLAPFRKKQQVAFNAYPLTLLQKIRSAAKPTTPVSVRVKHNEEPSYKAGYAKSADESASPHLWNGLVGAWMPSLGVTGDTLRDVSGNGNHGTLTGMDAATDWVTTSKGLALDFDGSNDYVKPYNLPVNFTKDFSFSINISSSSASTVVAMGHYASFSSRWWVGFTSGKLRFLINIGGTNHSFLTPYAVNDSRWVNAAASVSQKSNVVSFYIDGVLFGSQSTSGTYSNTGNTFSIGRYDTAGFYWQGRISNTSIYNRALSPQEIQELYVDSLAPFRRKAKPIGYQPNKELIGLFRT